MTLFLIALIAIGPFVAVAPGALLTMLQAPEFLTGRRPSRPRPVAVVRRWQVA